RYSIHDALPQLLTPQDIHTGRVDSARTDSVDADTVRRQLLGQGLRKPLYGEIGRTVGRRVRHTTLPHNRREVDNSPTLVLLQQRGDNGFTEQKRSHYLDVQHTAKQLLAEFDRWNPVSAPSDRGIIDQNVDAAKRGQRLLYQAGDVSLLADISDKCETM